MRISNDLRQHQMMVQTNDIILNMSLKKTQGAAECRRLHNYVCMIMYDIQHTVYYDISQYIMHYLHSIYYIVHALCECERQCYVMHRSMIMTQRVKPYHGVTIIMHRVSCVTRNVSCVVYHVSDHVTSCCILARDDIPYYGLLLLLLLLLLLVSKDDGFKQLPLLVMINIYSYIHTPTLSAS